MHGNEVRDKWHLRVFIVYNLFYRMSWHLFYSLVVSLQLSNWHLHIYRLDETIDILVNIIFINKILIKQLNLMSTFYFIYIKVRWKNWHGTDKAIPSWIPLINLCCLSNTLRWNFVYFFCNIFNNYITILYYYHCLLTLFLKVMS